MGAGGEKGIWGSLGGGTVDSDFLPSASRTEEREDGVAVGAGGWLGVGVSGGFGKVGFVGGAEEGISVLLGGVGTGGVGDCPCGLSCCFRAVSSIWDIMYKSTIFVNNEMDL